MATVAQYAFFKALYDEEFARHRDLESRARLYLTIVTLYLGALAFKLADLQSFMTAYGVSPYHFLAPTLALVIGLLCTLGAIHIRTYEGASDPEELILSLGAEPPTDEDFFDDRIVDLAVATRRNVDQNNKAASLLECASFFIAIAVVLHGGVVVLAMLDLFRG